jgi:hypothetical protein
MRRKFLPTSVIFFASLMCSQAWAADFTLTVPLRLENVPTIESLTIDCRVSIEPVGGRSPMASYNLVGSGSALVGPIRDGHYSGNVTVEVVARGVHPPSSAKSYSCSISARVRATTGGVVLASSDSFRRTYETATGHTLDSVAAVTSGNF